MNKNSLCDSKTAKNSVDCVLEKTRKACGETVLGFVSKYAYKPLRFPSKHYLYNDDYKLFYSSFIFAINSIILDGGYHVVSYHRNASSCSVIVAKQEQKFEITVKGSVVFEKAGYPTWEYSKTRNGSLIKKPTSFVAYTNIDSLGVYVRVWDNATNRWAGFGKCGFWSIIGVLDSFSNK